MDQGLLGWLASCRGAHNSSTYRDGQRQWPTVTYTPLMLHWTPLPTTLRIHIHPKVAARATRRGLSTDEEMSRERNHPARRYVPLRPAHDRCVGMNRQASVHRSEVAGRRRLGLLHWLQLIHGPKPVLAVLRPT